MTRMMATPNMIAGYRVLSVSLTKGEHSGQKLTGITQTDPKFAVRDPHTQTLIARNREL